jgi:hypothetical protein
LQVLVRHLVPVLIDQLEWAAHLGPAHTLGRLSYPLAFHALLFALEIPHQASGRDDEEKTSFPRKWLPGTSGVSQSSNRCTNKA